MRTRKLSALAALLTLLATTHAAEATPPYRVQPIPSVTYSPNIVMSSVQVTGINTAGIVVGYESELGTSGAARAQAEGIVWNGTSKRLRSAINAISDANICAGASQIPPSGAGTPTISGVYAFNCVTQTAGNLYQTANPPVLTPLGIIAPVQTGVSRSVPSLNDQAISTANAINASGQMVGRQYIKVQLPATGGGTVRETSHAYLATPNSAQDLGALTGGVASSANAINSGGDVAGWSEFGNPSSRLHHAFRWHAGTAMVDLGTLGGSESEAAGINDAGQVVGFAQNVTQQKHAVAWTGTVIKDLGTLGGAESRAYGVSGNRVVGTSQDATGNMHAFLYDLGAGTLTDLNSLLPANSGWVLIEARVVNAGGTIAGLGAFNGTIQAFVLTPPLVIVAPREPIPAPVAPRIINK